MIRGLVVGRRRVVMGVLSSLAWKGKASADASKGGPTPDEALEMTYQQLLKGAAPYDASDVQTEFKKQLKKDFEHQIGCWDKVGKKVLRVGDYVGRMAALMHECRHNAADPVPHKIAAADVLLAAVFVQESKICRNLRQDAACARGRFCTNAYFGKLGDAKALLDI